MNKRKILNNAYLEKERKLEKKKNQRTLIAILILTTIICCFIFFSNKPKTIVDFITIIVASLLLAIVDLYIHLVIFSFTLFKNEEDHKRLYNK